MRVLVACEYSGVVRDAFTAAGHDAMSCDLLPTDAPGPHYQGDVFSLLNRDREWDLLIAHPPCTFLSNSGVRWLYHNEGDGRGVVRNEARWDNMRSGALFFQQLLGMRIIIPHVAVENPIMHKHAAAIVGSRQTQIIQPWMFGHPEQKATGLWLRGLSPLVPTDDVRALMETLPIQEQQRIHYASPGPDRWKLRSTTYTGIAAAMAAQWGAPDLLSAVA